MLPFYVVVFLQTHPFGYPHSMHSLAYNSCELFGWFSLLEEKQAPWFCWKAHKRTFGHLSNFWKIRGEGWIQQICNLATAQNSLINKRIIIHECGGKSFIIFYVKNCKHSKKHLFYEKWKKNPVNPACLFIRELKKRGFFVNFSSNNS